MTDIYQIAAIGMDGGRQRLEAISLNATSASLPGYRRHVATGVAFDAHLGNAIPGADPASRNPPAQVDLRPAALMSTGRPLDMAIEGDDLFFALSDGAQTWITRAGSFRLDDKGVLTGERGLHVVGTQGDIRLGTGPIDVAADGRISQQGAVVGTVQLFSAIDRRGVVGAGGSLLTAGAGLQPAAAGVGRLHVGALEASNTDASREMLDLVPISRQFEGLSRIVQGYDDAIDRAIQKLGEF